MAVYTPLSNEQIAEFLQKNYVVGTLDFAVGIAEGVENTNYLIAVKTPAGGDEKYILTLYEKRVSAEDLPFFLNLLQHVSARGLPCPKLIVRRDKKLIGTLAGKQTVLVSFLHGKSRSIFQNQHVAAVGAALAQLHRATGDFAAVRKNDLSLGGWQKIYEKIKGRCDEIQPGLEQMLQEEIDFAAQHFATISDLPTGVIHADLFPDNVFFEGDAISGMIDFYFACTDALAYDVAITLNAWCFEPRHEFSLAKFKALLDAYQKVRTLTPAEKKAFPVLLRGAALRFLLTRAHDWIFREENALVRPHDPIEYFAKLKFHRQVKDISDYGL